MGHSAVLSFCDSHALVSRPLSGSPKSYQTFASTSARLFRHRHTAQRQQIRLTGARCCDGGDSGADSGGSDHSSFDSGHSHSSYNSGHSHASDHSSSSHGSSSHPDRSSKSDHGSMFSSLSGGDHDNNRRSSKGSKHDHEDSKHGHRDSKHDSDKNSDSNDSFLSDSALDVVSMFDTTETGNTSVEYRPSSGTYNKPPQPTGLRNFDQPTNPDFWAYKPVWCQPWSIISTGIAFVAGARWITGGSPIATVVAAVPILVWWYVFLILVPGDFRKYADK